MGPNFSFNQLLDQNVEMRIVEFHRDRQNLRPEQIDDPDFVVPSSSSWREIKNKPGRVPHGYGRCGLGPPECMH